MVHNGRTVRTTNHLAAMPSLEALAAPWNKDDDQFTFFDHNGGWDEVNSAAQDNINVDALDTVEHRHWRDP